MCQSCYYKFLQQKNNKTNHSKNGNKGNNNGLKLLHFNKGNSNFDTKIDKIKNIINDHKPHIMNLAEANFKILNSNINGIFTGYNIETNKMANLTGISRNILIINNTIAYKRRFDLESTNTCTIWIQIKIKGNKPLLLMGGYRQWRLPQFFNMKDSNSPKNQLLRWNSILEKWSEACNENKTLLVISVSFGQIW